MQPSDFLTIIGLAIAVWTVIPNKEKRFILLFFSKFEIFILGILLAVIHYLMAFDWLLNNWFPCFEMFTVSEGIPASIWAYILALFTIFYPVIKVSFGYFSPSRMNETIYLYETYLKENEIDLLVNKVNEYHKKDINQYLRGISNIPTKSPQDIILKKWTEHDEAHKKLVKPKRISFAEMVYYRIIKNKQFIVKTADKYPILFATVIGGMETPEAADEDFVMLFIECIFKHKNQSFVQELQVIYDSGSPVKERQEAYNDVPILYSILAHTKTAVKNHVWYPIGQGTIRLLKHDREERAFLGEKYDEELKRELWNRSVYIAIRYFDYMVSETIYRDSEWHMWLYYFRNFTAELIIVIPRIESDLMAAPETFAHRLIGDMFDVMIDWLHLAKDQNTEHRVIDTIRCLGDCIYIICHADDSKISSTFKRDRLEQILSVYFEFSKYNDNVAAITSREWLEKMFLNPKEFASRVVKKSDKYLIVLQEVWNRFDKVPYQGFEENGSVQRFGSKVLKPLGL